MENPVRIKIGIIVGTLLLAIAFLVWKSESPDNPPLPLGEAPSQMENPDQNENRDLTAENGPFDSERRAVDIDTVITEIEMAAAGDESALDDELSDETKSVQEGQGVIEDLGKSYDETGY